jgi:type IV secretory pathway VirB10-like protein
MSSTEEEVEQDEHYSSEASSDCEDMPDQPSEPPQFVHLTTAPTVPPPVTAAACAVEPQASEPVAATVATAAIRRAQERLQASRSRDAASSAPHITRFQRERATRATASAESADRQLQTARSLAHQGSSSTVSRTLAQGFGGIIIIGVQGHSSIVLHDGGVLVPGN